MIWGGPGGTFRREIFFSPELLPRNNFPGEGPREFFFSRLPPPPPPRSLMVVPLSNSLFQQKRAWFHGDFLGSGRYKKAGKCTVEVCSVLPWYQSQRNMKWSWPRGYIPKKTFEKHSLDTLDRPWTPGPVQYSAKFAKPTQASPLSWTPSSTSIVILMNGP